MIARNVGLLTMVAALFGWMSGSPRATNPFPDVLDEGRASLHTMQENGPEDRRTDWETREINWRETFPQEWRSPTESSPWKYIVIHHTATERDNVASLHDSHLKRRDDDGQPWLGIGYHFVIGNGHGMGDGEIECTFRWRDQLPGAHAGHEEFNQHGIGIALVGNFEQSPPTAAQLESVRRLVGFLKRDHHIPSDRVIGHRAIKATDCPGNLFPLADIANTELQ
jgi:hypothetical protein